LNISLSTFPLYKPVVNNDTHFSMGEGLRNGSKIFDVMTSFRPINVLISNQQRKIYVAVPKERIQTYLRSMVLNLWQYVSITQIIMVEGK